MPSPADIEKLKEFGRLKTSSAARLIPAPPKLSDYPKIKKLLPEVEKYDADMKKFAEEQLGQAVNSQ